MSEAKLGVVDIEITHRDGVELFNPHTLIMAIHDASDHTLDFAPTDQISAISKKPALIYRTDEVTIPLTSEEISRLSFSRSTTTFMRTRPARQCSQPCKDNTYQPYGRQFHPATRLLVR
jgi:hypothetical protein